VTVTLAVAGAKGGVGKTTTSVNLCGALADRNYRSVVVECDLAMANVADFVSVDGDIEEGETLHDVLAGETPVERARYPAPGGFDVVPSGADLEGFAAADPGRIATVVTSLADAYDCVVLDTGPGVSRETMLPLEIADGVVFVSTPRRSSVRDTGKTIDLVDRVGGSPAGLVLTKSGTGQSPPAGSIGDFLEVGLLGHVPEDDAVPAAQDAGQPVTEHAPESGAARAYRTVVAELDERYGEEIAPADYGGPSQAAPSSSGR